MELANQILATLYDRDGAFVWTDELVSAAGGDREALAGALEAICQRGHEIEQSPAHGVRLLRPTALDAHLIERGLAVQRIGRHVICFGEVDSTNDVAFDSAEGAGGESLVVTAEFQRAGRGRLGREWTCPPGRGLLASVLLGANGVEPPQEALTIAAGLAVAEGIERAAGAATQLEWPNDVLIDGAKVAGVLVETRSGSDSERNTVVGFGVNVSSAPDGDGLRRPATCLTDVGGAGEPERIEILRAILIRLDHWVAEIRAGRTAGLHDAWVSRCGMINRRVTVRSAGECVTGRVLDVSPLEGLILATDSGEQRRLSAAISSLEK